VKCLPDRENTVIKKQWIFATVATLAAFGSLAFVAQDRSEAAAAPDAGVPYGPEGQPIAFPHNVHAGSGEGQFQIECMYCHFSVERSSSAGIPPVSSCIGCHAYVSGQGPDEGARFLGSAGADSLEPDLQGCRPCSVPSHAAHRCGTRLLGVPRQRRGNGCDPEGSAAPDHGMVPDLPSGHGCFPRLYSLPLLIMSTTPQAHACSGWFACRDLPR
jgi:hypothetical protein